MDYSHTRTLLRLNNLAESSSPDMIRTFLTQVHYSEADIAEFLQERDAIASGKPLPKQVQNRNMPYAVDHRKELARRKGNIFGTLVKLIIFLAFLGVAGYVAYAAYVVPPEESVLGGAISLVGDKEYRIQFSLHSTATPTHGQETYTASADIDARNPSEVRSNIGSAFESADLTQNISLLLIGDKNYMQVRTLKVLNDYIPTDTTWYEIPPSVFADTNISGAPINPVILFRSGTTHLAQSLATLFDIQALSSTETPRVTLQSGRPVIVYTLSVDNKKLASTENTGLQLQGIEFGPIVVTKDLITRKITLVRGTFTTQYKNEFGKMETIPWEFQGNYYPIESLSIVAPENPQPLASFQALISSTTQYDR